ncbi:MAG: FKBP-type peptidyl-prolyl cis-trans isomerase [Rhodoferax sp.]
MSSPIPRVQDGSFLTLHYRMSGPQGVVISTFEGKPATLTIGTGQLAPAVEEKLLGLEEGAQAQFDLPAGAAFGERNPEMQQWVSREELDSLGDPMEQYVPGDAVHFPTPDGQGQFAGVVLQVAEGQGVQFDFNHPLAGQPVRFEVHVIGVL